MEQLQRGRGATHSTQRLKPMNVTRRRGLQTRQALQASAAQAGAFTRRQPTPVGRYQPGVYGESARIASTAESRLRNRHFQYKMIQENARRADQEHQRRVLRDIADIELRRAGLGLQTRQLDLAEQDRELSRVFEREQLHEERLGRMATTAQAGREERYQRGLDLEEREREDKEFEAGLHEKFTPDSIEKWQKGMGPLEPIPKASKQPGKEDMPSRRAAAWTNPRVFEKYGIDSGNIFEQLTDKDGEMLYINGKPLYKDPRAQIYLDTLDQLKRDFPQAPSGVLVRWAAQTAGIPQAGQQQGNGRGLQPQRQPGATTGAQQRRSRTQDLQTALNPNLTPQQKRDAIDRTRRGMR
jgi:hypothetical protein